MVWQQSRKHRPGKFKLVTREYQSGNERQDSSKILFQSLKKLGTAAHFVIIAAVARFKAKSNGSFLLRMFSRHADCSMFSAHCAVDQDFSEAETGDVT